MAKKSALVFPKNFLWGANVSAQQTEGDSHNSWTVWEQDHARVLAAQAPYHYDDLTVWPKIKKLASTPANYISGRAVDHYNRYEQDFDLVEKLNLNALRFGVDWARIEPEEGAWNVEAIAHYKEYIASLQDRGIEPILTLWQVALPEWFAALGGFEKKANVRFFVRYAEKIAEELGLKIRYLLTMDNPNNYVQRAYRAGEWPPGAQDVKLAYRVTRNLLHAHKEAAQAIHAIRPRTKISLGYNVTHVYAGDDARLSEWSASRMQYMQNDYFLKRARKSCDFLAVNYQRSSRIYGYRVHNPEVTHTDTGWEFTPEYLEEVLVQLSEMYHLPILVAGNGLADAEDELRQNWIEQSIRAMNAARKKDVALLGYVYDSLLDGVEYDMGRWPRFGLIEVDYRTLERTLRPSAVRYGKVIAALRKG